MENKYTLHIFEPGVIDEPVRSLYSDLPFSIARGDLIHPGQWEDDRYKGVTFRVVCVEHLIGSAPGAQVPGGHQPLWKHSTFVYTKAEPNTLETRMHG